MPNGRAARPNRQSSSASTAPLWHTMSTDTGSSSPSSGCLTPVTEKPEEPANGRITLTAFGPTRQDSGGSSTWLIPASSPTRGDFFYQLPSVAETSIDNYASRTLPKPATRPPIEKLPAPTSSDPPRRRHLVHPDASRQPGTTRPGYGPPQTSTTGSMSFDDDDDDDNGGGGSGDYVDGKVAAIHQSRIDKFDAVRRQAELMEEGLETPAPPAGIFLQQQPPIESHA